MFLALHGVLINLWEKYTGEPVQLNYFCSLSFLINDAELSVPPVSSLKLFPILSVAGLLLC